MPTLSLYHDVLAPMPSMSKQSLKVCIRPYGRKKNSTSSNEIEIEKKKPKKLKILKNHWLARKHTTAYRHNINSIRHALKQFSTDTLVYSKQVGIMAFHMLGRRMQTSRYARCLNTARFYQSCGLFGIMARPPLSLMSTGWTFQNAMCTCILLFTGVLYTQLDSVRFTWAPVQSTRTHTRVALILISPNLLNGWITHNVFHLFTHMIAVEGAKSSPANECDEYYNSSILIKRNFPTLWQRMASAQ